MTSLYELAKQVDVLVVFFLVYGLTVSMISSAIVSFIRWCGKKWTAHKEKNNAASKAND